MAVTSTTASYEITVLKPHVKRLMACTVALGLLLACEGSRNPHMLFSSRGVAVL